MITKLDFVAIDSPDFERSRRFYADTLGLRADEHAQFELWAGDTCLGIWEPARFGMEFTPQKNAHLALHVDDVADARAELEAKGVKFVGELLDRGREPARELADTSDRACLIPDLPDNESAAALSLARHRLRG